MSELRQTLDGSQPDSPPAMDADILPFVKCGFVPETKVLDIDERTVTHVISTDSVDRMGDMVDAKGWRVERFMRNPVVLVDHDYRFNSIVGKATELRKTRDGLVAKTQFYDMGIGAAAFAMVQAGFAKAWSVGFEPIAAHRVATGAKQGCAKCRAARDAQIKTKDDSGESIYIRGTHYIEQELLEYSLVAIPMNPDAVMDSVRRGLVDRADVPRLFSANQPEALERLTEKILAEIPKQRATQLGAGDGPKAIERTGKARTDLYGALLDVGRAARRFELGLRIRREKR